jgi:catechol 2,3-dioxygenase-like lactoylglutathione lyase family enzyme
MTQESPLGLVLWTTDIQALSRFLSVVGGFTVEGQHPGFAVLRAEGATIQLHADETFRGHPWHEALAREGVARGIGAELRLRVADVEQSYSAALRLGGLAIEAPCDVDGTRECQVMGPDGFLVTVWQPL